MVHRPTNTCTFLTNNKNYANSCFNFFFLNSAITFDSDTLKNAYLLYLIERIYFFIIDKFVYIKNVCLCIISMRKSGKLWELQKGISNLKYLKPSNGGILQFLTWTTETWSREQFFQKNQLCNTAGVKFRWNSCWIMGWKPQKPLFLSDSPQ